MTTPPVDTSREAIERVRVESGRAVSMYSSVNRALDICDALRTELDAAKEQSRQIALNYKSVRDDLLIVSQLRDAANARADRVAGALRDLACEYRYSDESVGLFAMPELANDLAELANELSPAKDSPTPSEPATDWNNTDGRVAKTGTGLPAGDPPTFSKDSPT